MSAKPTKLTPAAEAELYGELCNISFRDHHDWPFIDPDDDGGDPQLHTCERAREAAWHIMAVLEKAGLHYLILGENGCSPGPCARR